MKKFKFSGTLWRNNTPGGWTLITLPKDLSMEVKALYEMFSPGFGSIRVDVKIGATKWKTSIFYDTKFDAYLLPVKGDVRKKEKLSEGMTVNIEFEIIT